MVSRLYPWASTIVLGGTDGDYRASPLPDAYGGALGEAKWNCFFPLM